jgi:hypothetical protein
MPLLELIVRNIARYPQSATSTPIRYQPAICYLLPWSMVGQLLPNTNEMLQCILALQNLELNTVIVAYVLVTRLDALN